MIWKNLKLSKKFLVGFGVVILMLLVVCGWSILGIGGIVGDAGEVIDGNKLRGELVQKEVDHLNWANSVNALLTDQNVTELSVQTYPQKCAFGTWYYGEGRKHAEELLPILKSPLAALEDPHSKLHTSALAIGENFIQADLALGNFLREKKTDHLAWAHKVKDVFVDTTLQKIDVEMDHTQCGLGQWLYSPEVEELRSADPTFASAVAGLGKPHRELHDGARHIAQLLAENKREEARAFYMSVTKPLAYNTLDKVHRVIAWHDNQTAGMQRANAIYANETKPNLTEVQRLLREVNTTVLENVMTDAQMLSKAAQTRTAVIVISFIAVLLGILFAFIIARGILGPLQKGVLFAQTVADGDLTQRLDVDQQDEIGMLAAALNGMVGKLLMVMQGIGQAAGQVASASEELSASSQNLAQGSTEQTASISEAMANVDMLVESIRDSAKNAVETDGVSSKAALEADRGGQAVIETVDAMKRIASQIGIIDDIADQTNLLALNAAIEAARAGEMGRGFAVVAVEVRKLAERSQASSQEISELADNSVKKAEGAGQLIQNVVPGIKNASELVQQINFQCTEQTESADQLRDAIHQFETVTESNAAVAEESASASEELAAQAQAMQEMVGQFRLTSSASGHLGPAVKNEHAFHEVGYRRAALPVAHIGRHDSLDVTPDNLR